MRNSVLRYMPLINMDPINITSPYFFRVPTGKGAGDVSKTFVKDKLDEDLKDGERILCRQCRQLITTTGERIEIQGAHQHTFFNPHGIVYEIGCFRSVIGCRYSGPPTNEFSWFAGYSWRISVCSKCLLHLGWLYLSDTEGSFSGLILNHIIEDIQQKS